MEEVVAVEGIEKARKVSPAEVVSWIRQARAGDSQAFRQLVILYQRQVLHTAYHLMGRIEQAQDAAQEVFLRLFRSLDRIRAEQEISPWLYRVTINVCRDLWRKSQPATFLSLESLREENNWDPPTGDASLEERLLAEEKRHLPSEAIGRLPPKEREALVLREGQKVVVKKSTVDGSNNAIFLVLSAKGTD